MSGLFRSVLISLLLASSAVAFGQNHISSNCPSGLEVQQLVQQRQEMARKGSIFAQSGMGHEAEQLRSEIIRLDWIIKIAHFRQWIENFKNGDEPNCATLMLRDFSGQAFNVEKADDRWNLIVGGVLVRPELDRQELAGVFEDAMNRSIQNYNLIYSR